MSASSSARPTPRPRASVRDVDAFPGDAAVDLARRITPQRGPANDLAAGSVAGDEAALRRMGAVEVAPVRRLPLQRRVAGRDALGIDAPDSRPVGERHRRDGEGRPAFAAIAGPLSDGPRSRSGGRRVARRAATTSSPGLEIAAERRLADLEQAARPDRPAADEVARAQAGIRRGAGKHLAERELRIRPATAARLGPVDLGGHGQVIAGAGSRVGELVGRDQPRSEGAREVLALGRPEPDGGLVALQVARRPVVEDRVAADRLLGPLGREVEGRRVDDRRDLQLVVELVRRRRRTRPGRRARGSPRHC